jgi:alanyl-tRNA synthetase
VTDRLYYNDCYLSEFDATLLQIVALEDGRQAAVLDRTAFYPTSGGQPFDTGTLGRARVADVIDSEDGTVFHVVEETIEPGPVRGRIDWERRFAHMQQHTGQHVLSAAFDRLLNARTASFHLGSVTSTIDLARETSASEIDRAELEANRIVWDDRPVSIRFVDEAEAAQLPLRKEPIREGLLRIVEVADFDLSACGGTHVSRTGAIGIIAVSGWERFRGGTRVEFACGGRALQSHRRLRDSVASSIRLVSSSPADLPSAIERLQNEGKDLKRQIKDLHGRLASFEADAFSAAAENLGGVRAVLTTVEGFDASGLKSIAAAIVQRSGHVAVLLGAPPPFAVVVARSSDLTIDSASILKPLLAAHGGKGGGRAELAQGAGLAGSSEEILARARSLLAPATTSSAPTQPES